MTHYDIAILGAGPAGYVGAIKAALLGAKVCVIEKAEVGGTCLNVGCIPTKALFESAVLYKEILSSEKKGITLTNPQFDYAAIVERKDAVVKKLTGGVRTLFKSKNVDLIQGYGTFLDANTIEVKNGDETQKIRAKNIIIATGSEPLEIKPFAYDHNNILSSTDALKMKKLPKSMIILGGGFIGCEFGVIFKTFGVDVTIVEMMDTILPNADGDIVKELTKHLKKQKIRILTGTKMESVDVKNGAVKAKLSSGETIEAEKLLVSVGRKIKSDNLGLENAGVDLGEKGAIPVNDHCQTNVPNIYAVGDVNGQWLLAHYASKQAMAAVDHIMGKSKTENLSNVPAAIFTDPEIGSVGLTEEQAKEKGLDYKVAKFPFMALGKAQVIGHTEGFVKLIGDAKTGELIGAHIIGPGATELVAELTLAKNMEITIQEIARTIHAHPTLAESLMEAAEVFQDSPIHIP